MISPTLMTELRSTSKPLEKQQILKDNDCEFLRYLLKSAYEPFEVYHVKIKQSEIPSPGKFDTTDPLVNEMFRNVIEFCRNSNSHKQNRERILPVLSELTKDTQDLLLGVLHKNLKVGVSSKIIEKVFPGMITQFNVQLSNTYGKVCKKKTYKPKSRYCSYKLDGIRCIFLRIDDDWKAFSRQGKEFLTVDHLKKDLELLWEMHGADFFDGELYIPGNSFEDIQSYATSFTKGTAEELEYHVFICGDKEAFFKNVYAEKFFKIVDKKYHIPPVVKKIVAVKQELIEESEISERLEEAFSNGYEGIMLRDPDRLYDFKRSDALIKLKENESENSQEKIEDCLILSVDIDKYPVIIDGSIIYKDLIVRIYVEQKNGKICKVGSGFSLDFREKNKDDLINKVAEIKFQGYGSKGLMRFPRLYRVREDLEWEN